MTHATLNTEFIVGHKDVAKSDELVPVVNWSPRFAAKLKNRPHHMLAPGLKCLLCPSNHMSVSVGKNLFLCNVANPVTFVTFEQLKMLTVVLRHL